MAPIAVPLKVHDSQEYRLAEPLALGVRGWTHLPGARRAGTGGRGGLKLAFDLAHAAAWKGDGKKSRNSRSIFVVSLLASVVARTPTPGRPRL